MLLQGIRSSRGLLEDFVVVGKKLLEGLNVQYLSLKSTASMKVTHISRVSECIYKCMGVLKMLARSC